MKKYTISGKFTHIMDANTALTTLSPREQEILKPLFEGVSLKEIAMNLGISYKSIEYHMGNLYRKFGIQSMQELLVMYANNKKEFTRFFSKTINMEFIPGDYNWITYNDDLSSIVLVSNSEVMEGQTIATCNLYGNLSSYQINKGLRWAGIMGIPNDDTLAAMKSMSSFSFKALGDGNDYWTLLPTAETRDSTAHYFKPFSAAKGEITAITINIDDLNQLPSLNHVQFIQENIYALQFHSFRPGPFNLKIWDIRLYP